MNKPIIEVFGSINSDPPVMSILSNLVFIDSIETHIDASSDEMEKMTP